MMLSDCPEIFEGCRLEQSAVGRLTGTQKTSTVCHAFMTIKLEQARVTDHAPIQGGYKLLWMDAPSVAPQVRPGQFVHVLIPHLGEAVLRRPFSVFKAEGNRLAILYKDVGRGTKTLGYLRAGEGVNLIGPLGNGYPEQQPDTYPLLVAGGYGMAALYMKAQRSPSPGVAFFGGRTAGDILCVEEFEALGWEVRVTTNDGSLGVRGVVTDELDRWLARDGVDRKPEVFACGPGAMLEAVSERALRADWPTWISVDSNMGCGVGACLTCVVKIKDGDGWAWKRSCKEGPVFAARDVVWEKAGVL